MPAEYQHSDLYLLQRLAAGDRQSFETLYLRYWKPLLNAAYKRMADRQLSEDIVQNVFLRLWNKREELAVADLGAYLHTAVRYETLNMLSRSKISPDFYDHLESTLLDNGTADSKLLSSELMNLIYAYAETLPVKRRQIFMMHIQSRLSTGQIANVLSLSQKTVQNQLHTALTGLKTRIIPLALAILSEWR